MASTSVPLAPPAKNIVVFKNGDPYFTGRKLVINQRQILTFETFLNEVTNNINAPVAVRNIYTPSGTHRILELNQLQNGNHYVAAGFEKFKKIELDLDPPAFLLIGKKPNYNILLAVKYFGIAKTRDAISNRKIISARWRRYIQMPCIVNIFRNGDLLRPPFRLILPKHVMSDWEQILAMVTEKANIRSGAVRRLCTMEGQVLESGAQLESGRYYVAVGSEKFKDLPYLELLVSKMSSQNTLRLQQMMRFKNYSRSKCVQWISGSLKLQSDKQRVQSSGDETENGVLVSPQTVRRKGKSANQEESALFFAKPVKVKLNQSGRQDSQAGTPITEDRNVFKVNEKRAELQGAPEIPDDENTKVELPIDKRVAEVIEDELIAEDGTYHVEEGFITKPQ